MANEPRDKPRRSSSSINVPMAEPLRSPERSSIVVPMAVPGMASLGRKTSDSFKGRGPKGYRRTDEHVRHAVEETLAADPTLDAGEIEVEVSNGEVRLSGTVVGPRARYAAIANAEAVAGPGRVQCALKIVGEP
jgi:osmotically-inducible protein OsmY